MQPVSPTNDQIVTTGALEAASALARLLRVPVHAEAVATVDVASLVGSHSGSAVVIVFEASGGVTGTLALVIDDAVAVWLASHISSAITHDDAIGRVALAALSELGNIVASAFLNGAAKVVGRTCLPSVPGVVHGATAEAVTSAAPLGTSLRVVKLRAQQQWFSLFFTG